MEDALVAVQCLNRFAPVEGIWAHGTVFLPSTVMYQLISSYRAIAGVLYLHTPWHAKEKYTVQRTSTSTQRQRWICAGEITEKFTWTTELYQLISTP